MAAPSIAAQYEPATNWSTNTAPKTVSVTVAIGDALIVTAIGESNTITMTTPSGGTGFTWTAKGAQAVASNCEARQWVTVATAAQTFTLEVTKSGATLQFGFEVIKIAAADFGGWGATFQGASNTTGSWTGTTTGSGSTLLIYGGDWNAANNTTRTARTIAGATYTETVQYYGSGVYSTLGGAYVNTGAAGAKTAGYSAPSGGKWSYVGIEILASAGGATTHTKSLTDPAGLTDSLGVVRSSTRTAATEAVGLTDTLSVTVRTGRTDIVGLIDAVTATVRTTRAITEAIGLTDSVTAARTIKRTLTDALGLVDASVTRSVGGQSMDVVGLTDATVIVKTTHRAAADALGATDAVSAARTVRRTVTDALGATDAVAKSVIVRVQITDTLAASDHLSIASDNPLTYTVTLTDPVGLVDELELPEPVERTATDTLGAGDSLVTTRTIRRTITDALGATDSHQLDIEEPVTYTVTLTDLIGIQDDARTSDTDSGVRRLIAVEARFVLTPVSDARTVAPVPSPRTLTPIADPSSMTFMEE